MQQGPFVANTREEIIDAIQEYRAGHFGAWPLDDDGPVLPHGEGRIARYPDGEIRRPPSAN